MKKTTVLVLAVTGSLLLPGGLWGVRTSEWDVTGREAMVKGTPTNVTIGPLGFLEIAPRFEPLGEISEYYAWAVLPDGEGTFFVGTGDQGKIFKVERSGKTTLLFDSLELDVLSLARDEKGNLYAGTSPDGTVYRIDRAGKASTFFDSPDRYVWDLVFDAKGDLYAATGEQGKVYRIDPLGNGELFYDSPETNVLCIARDAANDRFVLGGEGSGLVVAVDRNGSPRVLFDAPRGEIDGLVLDESGRIFAACSGEEEAGGGEGERAPKEKALLYRIETDGTVVLVWESDAEFIYALAPEPDGSVLVGTGSPGSLFRVTAEGEATEIKRMAESQVLAILRAGRETVVSTGNQGRLYRFGPSRSEEGTYESEVHDAENLCRWGILRWWGDAPDGTGLVFSTRSGNTKDPDPAWSGWQEIRKGENGGPVESPPARFAQWKAEFKAAGEKSPRIDRVALAYKEQNLAPRILRVDVTRVGDKFYQGPVDPRPEPLFQVLQDGTRVEYQPVESNGKEPGEAVEVWARSVRVVRWEVGDPNGDELLFDVDVRAEEDREWKPLDEDIGLRYYAWDTRSMPDGTYRVRVAARDDLANSEATAKRAERVSEPFVIDNTPPVIVRLEAGREGDRLRVRGEARDGLSPLRTAEVSVNAGEWRPADSKDEIFDDTKEEFDFSVKAGEGEEQILSLRVSDRAGNVAVGKAVVR